MTVLKRKKIQIIKSRQVSGKQHEPKATGQVIQGGKIVWVYRPVKLPYSPNHLTSKDIQDIQAAAERLPA